MKKRYIKPQLELVPFELNDAIASGCGLKVYNHTVESCKDDFTEEWIKKKEIVGDVNLTVDYNCDVPLDGYCYFTSNGTGNFLFNS